MKTDNIRRVRDGYISESTRGHPRALPAHDDWLICRTNMSANVRACTPLPRQNFHGKEGVGGSSPPEGSVKALQVGICCCLRWRDFDASRVRDGYNFGLAGTRGHTRHLATQRATCSRQSIGNRNSESSCTHVFGVARAGTRQLTSFASEGSLAIRVFQWTRRRPSSITLRLLLSFDAQLARCMSNSARSATSS